MTASFEVGLSVASVAPLQAKLQVYCLQLNTAHHQSPGNVHHLVELLDQQQQLLFDNLEGTAAVAVAVSVASPGAVDVCTSWGVVGWAAGLLPGLPAVAVVAGLTFACVAAYSVVAEDAAESAAVLQFVVDLEHLLQQQLDSAGLHLHQQLQRLLLPVFAL